MLEVPSVQKKRGRDGLPACLHVNTGVTIHDHLVLACRGAGSGLKAISGWEMMYVDESSGWW